MNPRRRGGRLFIHLARTIAYGLVFTALGGIALFVHIQRSRSPLEPWHTEEFEQEFHADDPRGVTTFEDYLRLEDRLFAEVEAKAYVSTRPEARSSVNRYHRGSRVDPLEQSPNWNRSFEFPAALPRGGVVLLHGLSDSPYSLRALGEFLRDDGFWVVGLRLPGHGTAPTGLTRASWQDWAAATRLAVRHVAEKVGPDRPLVLVGYSTGAPLALDYALSAETRGAPRPTHLVLLSPAIAVSPAAALAGWLDRAGRLPGLETLRWDSLLPEFDPYKYNSFPAFAGRQVRELTLRVNRRLSAPSPNGAAPWPRVLAFQSVVDATVSTRAVVDDLFENLVGQGHELVLFGVNRHADARILFRGDPDAGIRPLLGGSPRPYDVTWVTNETPDTLAVHGVRRSAGATTPRTEPLGLSWPRGIYSLSHVALPFPPDDPWYGTGGDDATKGLRLGRIEIQGERAVLKIPPAMLLRLRNNPFFPYLKSRVRSFLSPSALSQKGDLP